jgi:hypothetical protein
VIECIVTLDIFIKFSFFLFGFLLFFFCIHKEGEDAKSFISYYCFLPFCIISRLPYRRCTFFSGSTTATATTEKRMGHWVCLWITTKVVSLVDDGEKLVRRYRVAVGVPLLAGQRCSRKLT